MNDDNKHTCVLCINVIADGKCDLQNIADILADRAMECEGVIEAEGIVNTDSI